jgi:hypothetical protein
MRKYKMLVYAKMNWILGTLGCPATPKKHDKMCSGEPLAFPVTMTYIFERKE